MRKFLFLCLVKLDMFLWGWFGRDIPTDWMETAENYCWPGYDGEMFSDWARSF